MAGRRTRCRCVHLLLAVFLVTVADTKKENQKLYGVPPALSISNAAETRECTYTHRNFNYKNDISYCPAAFDSYMCWAPTPAGEYANQSCYELTGTKKPEYAYRHCGENGIWLGRELGDNAPNGWTNFSACYPKDSRFLQLYNDAELVQTKLKITKYSTIIELSGYIISGVSLLMAMLTFYYYRRNITRKDRITIHKHLFTTIGVQCLCRAGLIIEQMAYQSHVQMLLSPTEIEPRGLASKPYLCAAVYVALQYCNSGQYTWMLLEGVHMYRVLDKSYAQYSLPYWTYLTIGWGLSTIITTIWAVLDGLFVVSKYAADKAFGCWYGFSTTPYVWVLYGLRIGVIGEIEFKSYRRLFAIICDQKLVSRFFAFMTLLHQSKTTRAFFVLLPLLGITNVFDIFEGPMSYGGGVFGTWVIFTSILRAYQGFIIALIYCFLSAEVQQVVQKSVDRRKTREVFRRAQRARNRRSEGANNVVTQGRTRSNSPPDRAQRGIGEGPSWISMQDLNFTTLATDRSSTDPRRSSHFPRRSNSDPHRSSTEPRPSSSGPQRSSSAMSAPTRRSDLEYARTLSIGSGTLSPNARPRVNPRTSICTVASSGEGQDRSAALSRQQSQEDPRRSSIISSNTIAMIHEAPPSPTASTSPSVTLHM